MDTGHILIFVVLGAIFGFFGGLFGVGGGIVAIPVLGLAFGMNEQQAQGTSLVMVVPNVLIGLWRYYRAGGMDLRLAATLALGGVAFTAAGAHVATRLATGPLRIAFAIFLLSVAAYLAWRAFGPKQGAAKRVMPWPFGFVVGAIGGILSGIFSIGGATFAVPAMSIWFGLPQAAAQGMGLALVAPGTIVALIEYALANDVDWPIAIALAAGGFLTVSRGVDLAHRLPERTLRGLFIAFLLAAAAAVGSHAG
jgi:uncharacterized membrane protein YfcA